MNVILTRKIKNGGSTVQMNGAETEVRDAQVLIVGSNDLVHSNISYKKMECLEIKVLRHHVFLSWHDETFPNAIFKQHRGENRVSRN
jgi:hypothetical protein